MTKKNMPQPENKITCPDCKLSYTAGAPHQMFCVARTCTECQTTFGFVLSVYDSHVLDDDGNPERLCDNCLNDRLDSEDDDD